MDEYIAALSALRDALRDFRKNQQVILDTMRETFTCPSRPHYQSILLYGWCGTCRRSVPLEDNEKVWKRLSRITKIA